MALDVLTDNQFLTPDEYNSPCCPICDSQLAVEIEARDENGIPDYTGLHVFCQRNETQPHADRHREWEYDEALTAVGETISWCVEEVTRKRHWEILLWGESQIPDLENCY